MRVLVACEYSGRVRDAFLARGHDAMSCDLLPTDSHGPHYRGDVFDIIEDGWDLLVAFPPCTHLSSSGARWWPAKVADGRQQAALDFVRRLMDAPVERIAIENPVGKISTAIRPPDQIVQPWWFGDPHRKTTCLWLKNLPPLEKTNVVSEGEFHVTKSGRKLPSWYNLPPSPDRAKKRSLTFPGLAAAMAAQWG